MMTIEDIEQMRLDPDAIAHIKQKGDIMKAWQDCERGDWMLTFAKELNTDPQALTMTNLRCAELAKDVIKDKRILDDLESSRRYVLGEASRAEPGDARSHAAFVSVFGDETTSEPYVADAIESVFSPFFPSNAALCVASAVSIGYGFLNDLHVNKEKEKVLRQCADICREELTKEIKKKVE